MIVGLLYVVAPLNLGDGSDQLNVVFTFGEELGVTTLLVSGLLKMVSMGLCLGFGFVGGNVFPCYLPVPVWARPPAL